MRFPWPRTLLWRTFTLIALLMGISLLAWFQIYNQFALKPRAHQAAQMVVSVVNLTRSALIAADESQREALLHDLISIEGIRLYPAESTDKIEEADSSDFMEALADELSRRLGPGTRVASSVNDQEGFFVSFILDDEEPDDQYWLALPAERVTRGNVFGWFGWVAAVLLLALLGAWLLVLGVARPLKALERAAREVGLGHLPPPLPEHGPQEIVAVAGAFNQMSSDLGQLESDRALILAGISHDLRTPLSRLRLGVEMSGASTEDMEAMSTDIEEMDNIIRQFLDFARDAHQESSELCSLPELLNDITDAYRRRGKHVSLTTETLDPQPLRPQALRRAINNLVDNALRYSPPDSEIELSLRRVDGLAWIEVADRGPGIPLEQTERLKRPFTRLEEARSNVKGAGLGLAIVERIARLHGGNLALLPRSGGGLLARIELPSSAGAAS